MPTPLSLKLYALATGAASPLAPALLKDRVRRGKEDPARTGERLGRAGAARPDGGLVWMHGASVGEALSLLPLIETFAAERPDLTLLVTSGTTTSAALMAQRLPQAAIHQYLPIDTPAATKAFLNHWRPSVGIFVESEIWPNLLMEAQKRDVKLALLSAKMSDASFRGWSRFPAAARRLFSVFDLILGQDTGAVERLTELGAEAVGYADLKYGADPLPVDKALLAARRAELRGRPVVLAASTHPGEDTAILARWRIVAADHPKRPLLVLAPRHPMRGKDIATAARAEGFDVRLQSAGEQPDGSVFVADALGELGLWFRLAHLSIIGGSLVPGIGGHNPLEPARLKRPFISGANVENWITTYRELEANRGTCLVREPEDLDPFLAQALTDRLSLVDMAERANSYVAVRDSIAQQALSSVMALAPPKSNAAKPAP